MGYYDDGSTLPPPFNLIVSPKSIFYILCRLKLFLKNCVAQRQSKASKRRRKAAARLAKVYIFQGRQSWGLGVETLNILGREVVGSQGSCRGRGRVVNYYYSLLRS